MTSMTRVAVAALGSTLLSGCALFSSQIEVSRRYGHFVPAPQNGTIACSGESRSIYCFHATVSALPAPSSSSAVALTALSDRGQAAYVTAVAAAAKDPADLRAALAKPMKSTPADGLYRDQSSLDLRFVVGLFPINGYLNPADRLSWAKVSITPIARGAQPAGTPARFTAWTQAANAFEVIDVGSVTATRTDTLSPSAGFNIAKFLPDAKLSGEFSASREEKADIKDRSTISATISMGTGWLVQSGGWRRDLTGNSTFDATIALPPADTALYHFTTYSDLKPKKHTDGTPTPDWSTPADVKFEQSFVRVPRPKPLCAKVTTDFVVRHVVTGDRTFTESDDVVQFLRGSSVEIQTVAPPVITPRWSLLLVDSGGSLPLQFAGSDGRDQVLQFPDKGEALDFIAWLRGAKVSGAVGNGKLFVREGKPMTEADLAALSAIDSNGQEAWDAGFAPCPSS